MKSRWKWKMRRKSMKSDLMKRSQRTQVIELPLDLGLELGQRIGTAVAADEGVLRLRLRMAMQHRLPHRELVEIGVDQAVDHGAHRVFVHGRFTQASSASSSWLVASLAPRRRTARPSSTACARSSASNSRWSTAGSMRESEIAQNL
jgi:hypothetical protein